MPGEPSLYLAGDTVLTPHIRAFVTTHQPQVSLVPAGRLASVSQRLLVPADGQTLELQTQAEPEMT